MAKRVTKRALGGPVGWNRCKLEMNKSLMELQKTLAYPQEIPPKRRAELRLTLKKIRAMARVANRIDCSGPIMSFGLEYAIGEDGPARRATRRKKR
jgi:hypothetical protein